MMSKKILGLFLALVVVGSFAVGGPHKARASSAVVSISTSLTFNLVQVTYLSNGDKVATFNCLDSNGQIKKVKSYIVRTDGSGVYDTDNGSQLAASSTTLSGNLDTFKTNADSGMATAASGGKVVF
jgi:hypothetical protein